jgi:BirA family biotin operon repressor/biotin-[acetyl-CoA-carboxylase] ligase
MREGIDQSVTDVASLSSSGTAVSRNALLAAVLVQLVEVLDQFQREGFAPMLGEWTHLHALNGAAVRVHEGNGAWFDAHVRGVAEDGALIVMENGVERTVASGEVSVRARP